MKNQADHKRRIRNLPSNLKKRIAALEAQVAELEEWKTIARVMVYAHEHYQPRAMAEAIDKAKAKEAVKLCDK